MKKDGYHPDPKAASTLHSSDAELENIVAKAEVEAEAETKAEAEIDLPQGPARGKSAKKACDPSCGGSKKPVILLCLLVVLLLATLIVGYIVRVRPSTAVLQATANFFGAERVAMAGNIHLEIPYDEEFYNERYQKDFPAPAKDVVISFDTRHAAMAHSTTGYIKVTTADDDEFELHISDVITIDGVMYFKIDGLKEAYDGIEMPLILSPTTSHLAATAELADGTWWKFSVPELLASSTQLTAEEKAAREEAYRCVVKGINLSADYTKEFAQLYKDNEFLSSELYHGDATKVQRGGVLYSVKLNPETFDNFMTGFYGSTLGKNLTACTNPINIKPANVIDSILRYVQLDGDATAVFEVDTINQQVSRVFYTAGADDNTKVTADISIDYPSTLTLEEAPADADTTDARPLIDQYHADMSNVTYTYFYIDYGAK